MDEQNFYPLQTLALAFIIAVMETHVDGSGFIVPRYLETVTNQLVNYVRAVEDCTDGMVFITPRQGAAHLRAFAEKHAVVQEWALDLDAVEHNAADYLAVRAALKL